MAKPKSGFEVFMGELPNVIPAAQEGLSDLWGRVTTPITPEDVRNFAVKTATRAATALPSYLPGSPTSALPGLGRLDQYAQNPQAALRQLPVVGTAMDVADVIGSVNQAAAARQAGDTDRATKLNQMAAVLAGGTALGMLPVPGAKQQVGMAERALVRELTPQGLYSHAADVLSRLPQEKFSPSELKSLLTGPKHNVSKNEFRWTGFDDAFAGRKSLTNQEAQDFFKSKMVPLHERVLSDEDQGSAAYRYGKADITLPSRITGEKNYREIVTEIPTRNNFPHTYSYLEHEANDPELQDIHKQLTETRHQLYNSDIEVGSPEAEALAQRRKDLYAQEDMARDRLSTEFDRLFPSYVTHPPFTGSHYDENTIAHIRMADRFDADTGEKLAHLEENQSDLGQQGRKKGFSTPENDDPDKPYELPYTSSTEDWTKLTLKRALLEAAKSGADRLSWTSGDLQDKRYGLSSKFKRLIALPAGTPEKPEVLLEGYKTSDPNDFPDTTHYVHPDKLDEYVGKDLAEKIRSQLNWEPSNNKYVVQNMRSGFSSSPFNSIEEAEAQIQQYPENLRPDLTVAAAAENTYKAKKPVVLTGGDLTISEGSLKPHYDRNNPKILADILKKEFGVKAEFKPAVLDAPESISGNDVLEHFGVPEAERSEYFRNLNPSERDALIEKYHAETARKTVPSLVLSDELRQRILNEGFRNYAQGGLVEKYGV